MRQILLTLGELAGLAGIAVGLSLFSPRVAVVAIGVEVLAVSIAEGRK